MQTTINVSLEVPNGYSLDTLKKQLTEYAKELVSKTKVASTAKGRHYAHDALCGLAASEKTDEELLDAYLGDKYEL